MKIAIFVVLCFAVCVSAIPTKGSGNNGGKLIYNLDDAPAIFEKYIKDYNKSYKDEADKQEHYKAFVETLKVINRGNSNPTDTATYGLNDFADITPEQRKFLFGAIVPQEE